MKLRVIFSKQGDAFAINAIQAPAVTIHKAAGNDEFERMKRWDAGVEIEPPDAKKMVVIMDGDNVRDYRNVTIKGYLSTFKATTESDRQGDYVEDGAFRETIKRFMENPVMLADHRNATDALAGTFTTIREDKRGLFVEGMLSNAPGNIDRRFKVAEGHLKTLSMGGLFHYKEDGRGIFKVDLWEGSLTPIPANPDARFSVRALDDMDREYVKSQKAWPCYYDFVKSYQHRARNLEGVAA